MTNEEVMEQAREEVAKVIWNVSYWALLASQRETVKQILSIPTEGKTIEELIEGWASGKLVELATDQSLPDESFNKFNVWAYKQDILTPKDGCVWKKVIIKEE